MKFLEKIVSRRYDKLASTYAAVRHCRTTSTQSPMSVNKFNEWRFLQASHGKYSSGWSMEDYVSDASKRLFL